MINDINIADLDDPNIIKDIQSRLNSIGYELDIDGIVGPMTTAAWMQFKKDHYQANPEIVGSGSLRLLYEKSQMALVTKAQVEAIWENKIGNHAYLDLLDCLKRFNITTKNRIRHFLAQTGHESGGGKWMIELGTPTTIKTRPEGGFKYRGAGAIQLTHLSNYKILAGVTRDPKVISEGAPYVAKTYPFTSAGVWWQANGMNALIDSGATATMISRKINTGKTTGTIRINGLSDRLRRFEIACKVIP